MEGQGVVFVSRSRGPCARVGSIPTSGTTCEHLADCHICRPRASPGHRRRQASAFPASEYWWNFSTLTLGGSFRINDEPVALSRQEPDFIRAHSTRAGGGTAAGGQNPLSGTAAGGYSHSQEEFRFLLSPGHLHHHQHNPDHPSQPLPAKITS